MEPYNTPVKRILHNKARCKTCGVVLESTHRHDFCACVCGNFVDGGKEYLRRGGNPDDLEELSEYTTEPEPTRKRGFTTEEFFQLLKWLEEPIPRRTNG